jgi:hypothetical protein
MFARNFQRIDKPVRPKRDRRRFAGLPLAPRMRIIDPAALERARQRPRCEWCRTPCRPDPAHVRSVGSGGDDVDENIVSLCRTCHDEQHRGHSPTPDELRLIVQARQADSCGT